MDILISLSKPYAILTSSERAAFHRWFGKSIVVDKKGDPLRVYHGTAHDFNEFSKSVLGKGIDQFGIGFYFTDRSDFAGSYAETPAREGVPADKTGGNVMPVYLKMVRPIDVEKQPRCTYKQALAIAQGIGTADLRKFVGENIAYLEPGPRGNRTFLAELRGYLEYQIGNDLLTTSFQLYNDLYSGTKHQSKFAEIFARATKRDGVIAKRPGGNVYVVFSPTQIKSAIGNAGTFRPRTADLRA